ncbi:MAG: hybrid sensor histidine kinase/response regulator [Polyangiaceae bacterium]
MEKTTSKIEAASASPATILVVDDNEANRLLAEQTLEDEGYRVVLANDGRAGLAAFEKEPAACVLLDVRMPELDGFAVCERIRGMPGGARVPVIFLTALRDVDTFDHALRSGGDDFLTKPVRPAELVVRVQTALKLREMDATLAEHLAILKRQRDDLLRVQLQKERLTAFVVHDLKNPVSSMDLNAQLLLREQGLSDTAKASATQIRIEAKHLNRMILNLLDVSKGDEGKLAPKRAEVDLRAMTNAIASELDANAKSRKLSFDIALGTDHVRADDDLLRRAVTNLVENAIRHAPAGSTVKIAAARKENTTEIVVSDAGAGVPAELRDKIFDPFAQVEGADRPATRTGRGLGLTFCKLAIEAHGGTIVVEDAAPGALFRVRLPDEQ